jgi:RNA polymerase sigma-70 factor, ECF subfamily
LLRHDDEEQGGELSPDEEKQFWLMHEATTRGLSRKAYRMCGGHEADAQDALQEMYLKALRHWRTIRVLDTQRREWWLAKTLTNEVRQAWRRRRRFPEISFEVVISEGPFEAAEFTPDLSEYRRVCRAIACLQGREHEVISLHCLAGYAIREVAGMLGIGESTVRVHLHRGRVRLREILEAEGGGVDDNA